MRVWQGSKQRRNKKKLSPAEIESEFAEFSQTDEDVDEELHSDAGGLDHVAMRQAREMHVPGLGLEMHLTKALGK